MPLWVLIVWLIIGAGVGFAAPRMLSGQAAGGQLGDLVLGIVGALLGGYGLSLGLPPAMQATIGGLIVSLATAVIGALILVWVARRLNKSA